MKPFAVVTARGGSKRIPWKNMLPIGGKPLAELSILHALQAGLYTVVTSDIDYLLEQSAKLGCLPVRRPKDFCNGDRHFESIKHAVETAVAIDPSKRGSPVVLLQPTSPFRVGKIIERCLEAHAENPDKVVLSGRTIHYADPSGKPVTSSVWDGCVAVYPQSHIGHQEGAVIVENEHTNMLQVDTEQDYIQACILHWRMMGHRWPIDGEELKACSAELTPILKDQRATVVARPQAVKIPQDRPVVWLNHCVGWDGGRADVLVVVASKNITNVGVNKELAEVAEKAKVVVIRDFGQAEWVLANLKTTGKVLVVKSGKVQVTTGAFASALAYLCGAKVERIGFQKGLARIHYVTRCFPEPLVSEEIAMLELSGTDKITA